MKRRRVYIGDEPIADWLRGPLPSLFDVALPEVPVDRFDRVVLLARHLNDEIGMANIVEFREELKTRCAAHNYRYDSGIISAAMDEIERYRRPIK